MRKKFLAISLALILAMGGGALLTFSANAAQTVTETCTLPKHSHMLNHTYSDSTTTSPGNYYCTVCGVAYRKVTQETFHPSGAPDGVVASKPIITFIDTDKGSPSESCSIAGCTIKGPHAICACGDISGKTHTRTYTNPNLAYSEIRSSKSTYNIDDAHAGDTIVVPSNGSYDTVLRVYMDDTLMKTISSIYGGTYIVPYDGVLKVEAELQYYKYAHYLCTVDSDGTRWKVPEVYGGFVGGNTGSCPSYGDGISMHGCQFASYSDGYVVFHGNDMYRVKMHLERGQVVTMTCKSNENSNTKAALILTDTSGNIVTLTDTSPATAGTVKALMAPSSGDYWVLPTYYWEYTDEGSGYYSSYSA